MPGPVLFFRPASGSVMTCSISHPVRAILLDIEGTTTPADFIFKVLFPYARSQTEKFLERYGTLPDVLEDLDGLRREHLKDTRQGFSPPVLSHLHEPASFVAYVGWLIDRDRK